MLESWDNLYQNALFSIFETSSKYNDFEQKSLLLESLKYIKKSSEDEDKE